MKKQKTLKALMFTAVLALGMLMPTITNAQSDGFFRNQNDYENRADEGLSNEIFGENNTFGPAAPTNINAPLGSGLLIMMMAGAGYAVARRKRFSKKGVAIVLACTMILGLTQCKKHVETISQGDAEKVFITLDLGSGAKHSVNTSTGVVTYAEGDKVHVGSDGVYVGTLTHDGTQFSGTITNPKVGEYLYFYFVSGLLDESAMSVATQSYTVNISEQRTQLPVLSVGVSTNPYEVGVTSYTSKLRNKCALVKFTLDDESAEDACLCSFQNTATVDFANNTITPNGGKDVIRLYNPSGSTASRERWAILLPQSDITTQYKGVAKVGNTIYKYVFWEVPHGIIENGYHTGNTITYLGARGFTVSANGNAVAFSKGNLQYNPASSAWRFAEHPWDIIGNGNANIAPDYDGWIDLFGWGTWGVGGNPTKTSTTNSDYTWTGDFGGTINAGYSGTTDNWRTLSKEEWLYVFYRPGVARRFIKTQTDDGAIGILLFPDDFNPDQIWQDKYKAPDASYNRSDVVYVYEADGAVEYLCNPNGAGAIFLPITGFRGGEYGTTYYATAIGNYWSSTPYTTLDGWAWLLNFTDSNITYNSDNECHLGYAVRLVCY